MAVRSTMAALIRRVSQMIGDPTNATWTEQQVQDQLDRRRTDVRYAPLDPRPSFQAGGVLNYTDYYAADTDWEDGATLVNTDWSVIDPATYTQDSIVGHWVFALPAPGQMPPVRVVGYTYDVWAAAADLLEQWAASFALSFDFTADTASYKVSQKLAQLTQMAALYRQKQKPGAVALIQSDQDPRIGTMGTYYVDDPNQAGR